MTTITNRKAPYTDPAIASPDPRNDARATALLKAQPFAISDWANHLHSLAELASQTSSHLHSIASGVHWHGNAAGGFLGTVASIRPELDNLSDSYQSAAQALLTYVGAVETDQRDFRTYAQEIEDLTGYLKLADPPHAGEALPSGLASTQHELVTAKQKAYAVLKDFDSSRQAVSESLDEAASRAPHAPPWWQRNIAVLLREMPHLKGVTAAERRHAADLANARKAFSKDPSAANKKRLERDLAALTAIANAAQRDGKTKQAKELLDDEAGALQRVSDQQQGLHGFHHDRITSTEEDALVAALSSGNFQAAEGDLTAMEASTFDQFLNHTKDPVWTGIQKARIQRAKLAGQAPPSRPGTNPSPPPAKKPTPPPAKKPTPPPAKKPAPAGTAAGTHPLTTSSPITIKGVAPNASQVANLNTVLAEAAKLHAPTLAAVALVEACIQESDCENLTYGGDTSTGILQFQSATAAGLGINPMNIQQCADAFLTKNYYYGPPFYGDAKGAIGYAQAHPGATADQIAQSCQGSAYPSAYGQWQSEAQKIVAAYGLG